MTEGQMQESGYGGRLFELYTKYVTEPESKKDVYGYTLLIVGYILAIGGMVLYFVGPTGAEVSESTLFTVRQLAAVPAATGLLLSLLGIVLLMPVTRLSLVVAVLGALLGLAAVVLFVQYYPYNWHQGTPSYSDLIIGLYTAGVGIVAGVVIMVPVATGQRSYFSETTEGPKDEHPPIMIGEADRGGLFTLFKRRREWTWRFIDQSAVAASSESFLSKLEAEQQVDGVKSQVASAGLLEIKHAAFRLYESAAGSWYWHLMREDGSAVAESRTEYETRDDAEHSINEMKDHGPDAEVFVMDEPVFDLDRSEGQWTWRLIDADRTPLVVAADSQTSRNSAIDRLESFRSLASDAMELVVESYGIELVTDGDAWGWRLRDSAHKTLATSAVEYESKGVAEDTVYTMLDRLERADRIERGEPTYDVYQSGDTWEWRLMDDAGRAVATGTASSDDPDPVTADAAGMQAHAGDAEVVEIENLEFETYGTRDGWAWRLVDEDRGVHARSTETYDSKEAASHVVERVRTEAPEAELIEFDNAAFQIYEAEGGAWRWRLIDEDGNVMADSGQGEYESKDDAMNAMVTLQENAPDAEHLEIETAAFELFQDDAGWGWRLVDDIGETIADSATRHENEEGARQAMESLIDSVSGVPERRMATGIFQIYSDSDDEWWWQFVMPDGRILADATESFGTRHEIEDAIAELRGYAGDAPVTQIGRLAVCLDPEDWSWELVDENREPVATSSRSFGDRQSLVAAVDDIQARAPETTVYEIREAAFDCYRGDSGWTWRLIDDDHTTLAHAASTFGSLEAVESEIGRISRVVPDAEFLDYDDVAFELYESDDRWTWRLVDKEQWVIAAAAERHGTREAAERDIEEARTEITEASVIEIDSATFEFHLTDEGWRWRLVDEAGNELAESIDAFPSRADAQEQLTTVKELGPDAWVSTAE